MDIAFSTLEVVRSKNDSAEFKIKGDFGQSFRICCVL